MYVSDQQYFILAIFSHALLPVPCLVSTQYKYKWFNHTYLHTWLKTIAPESICTPVFIHKIKPLVPFNNSIQTTIHTQSKMPCPFKSLWTQQNSYCKVNPLVSLNPSIHIRIHIQTPCPFTFLCKNQYQYTS